MIQFAPITAQSEWAWVKERASIILCEDSQGIVAFNDAGTIQAMAVFDTWTSASCNVHMAIDNPLVLRHGFLQEIGQHLFVTCRRSYIFGLVPANNPKALKLDRHIGMREVSRVPDAVAPGVDYIVLRLDKADCRWIPEELREAA